MKMSSLISRLKMASASLPFISILNCYWLKQSHSNCILALQMWLSSMAFYVPSQEGDIGEFGQRYPAADYLCLLLCPYYRYTGSMLLVETFSAS